MANEYAIEVRSLTKIYPPDQKAVDQLDLTVRRGEVMALLGPNGAGKSTAIRVLSTLSGFDDGQAVIDGLDVDTHAEQVRRTIGVVAQQTGVDYFLTGRENMMLQGRLYRMKKSDIKVRIDELSQYFELSKSLDRLVSTYSGGMRRKLDIATALIHRPKILFLDEPTLGLDIRSRKMLWRYIEELNEKFGLTILLTTHYLEEADGLADRVSIINSGKIQIVGTPDELKNGIHGDSVVLSFDEVRPQEQAFAAQLKQGGAAREVVWEGNNLHLYVDNGAGAVPQIMTQASAQGIEVKTLSLARPTLDDVFLKYTGVSLAESGEEEGEEWWHQWAGKGGGGNWKKWAGESAAEEGESDASAAGAWEGNEWVGKDGATKGDWGDSPDWQGNEWVGKDGKPKEDWSETAPQATAPPSAAAHPEHPAAGPGTAETSPPESDWQGNEWVAKDGKQVGEWGDAPDWQGNEWVDKDGKPKEDWGTAPDKKKP